MPNQPRFDDLPDLMTVDEVRQYLRLGRNQAYELVREGRIRSVQIGRVYRVPKDALREFLDQKS